MGLQHWKHIASDAHIPLTASRLRVHKRGWVIGFALILTGVWILANPPDRPDLTIQILLLCAIFPIGAGLLTLVVCWFPRAAFRKTLANIDESGVYLESEHKQPPVHIPWSEVRGVERTFHILQQAQLIRVLIQEPSLVISRDFYEREPLAKSLSEMDSVLWISGFQIDASTVRIVFLHYSFDLPRRFLFEALVTRWKTFGEPPSPEALKRVQRDSAATIVDRLGEARDLFMEVPTRRSVAYGLMIGVVVLAVFALDYMFGPRVASHFRAETAHVEAGSLLADRQLPVRLANGRMELIGYNEIGSIPTSYCVTKTQRNPKATTHKTRFIDRHTCYMRIRFRDNTQGTAVFLVQQSYSTLILANGQTGHVSVEQARAIALPEARALICAQELCRQ
jgi:hypothetical protein